MTSFFRILPLVVFSISCFASSFAARAAILPGSHQLFEAPYFEKIRGKRLGVLAHHASRDAQGRHLIDLLHGAREFSLTTIFAPEHGFRSAEDVLLPDSRDPVTGLPVYSLYGPRKAPTAELLANVDVLVIDLQDVGMRYYTYAATMALAMEAARANGKSVLVLDRPNPVGGAITEGAVLEDRFVPERNIAAFAPIASRHGMTLGELARMFNRTFAIEADLTVVPMSGWTRELDWKDTGLAWEAPSPALPTEEQAFLYAVFGTLETLNFAVGRGQTNEHAFRRYGAPWITAARQRDLIAALRALRLPGLEFAAVQWTPSRREYQGQPCRGFLVRVTDRQAVEGFRSLLEVVRTMKKLFGSSLATSGMDRMLGASWVRVALENGTPAQAILERVERESQAFRAERLRHLMY